MVSFQHTKRPNSEHIICPTLNVLYSNGIITPDDNGFVGKEDLMNGLAALGMTRIPFPPPPVLNISGFPALQSGMMKPPTNKVNIFKLNQHTDIVYDSKESKKPSKGIFGRKWPSHLTHLFNSGFFHQGADTEIKQNSEQFDFFVQNFVPADGRITSKVLKAWAKHLHKDQSALARGNKEGPNTFYAIIGLLLFLFGRREGHSKMCLPFGLKGFYFTVDDYKDLYFEGKIPEENWQPRPLGPFTLAVAALSTGFSLIDPQQNPTPLAQLRLPCY